MRKLMLLLAVFGLTGLLWAADHFSGNWKLDPSKTKVTGVAQTFKSGSATITSQSNGYKMVYDATNGEGKALHVEVTVQFDGKDHPVTGDPSCDSFSARRLDDFTEDRVLKKGGKEVATERVVVSKDGKMATVTEKSKDAKGQDAIVTTVWIKQ
jgi:hypothetical protein